LQWSIKKKELIFFLFYGYFKGERKSSNRAEKAMTTGVWTRLREVALFGPSSLFWFNSPLFIPLLSQPHLILLRAKKTPLFWGELTQANRSSPEPVTKALFQSHVITHQCHTTHTFQTGRVALWACGGKLSALYAGHSHMD